MIARTPCQNDSCRYPIVKSQPTHQSPPENVWFSILIFSIRESVNPDGANRDRANHNFLGRSLCRNDCTHTVGGTKDTAGRVDTSSDTHNSHRNWSAPRSPASHTTRGNMNYRSCNYYMNTHNLLDSSTNYRYRAGACNSRTEPMTTPIRTSTAC